MSGMLVLPRNSWGWDPLRTAVVATAVLAMIACATAGSVMLFASSPAPAAAPAAATGPVTPVAKAAPVVQRQKEKPSRSKSRYNPKPYKGPLPNIGNQAPAGVAHPPQVTEAPALEPVDDGWGDEGQSWPDRGSNGGGNSGHNNGGGDWWDRR